MKPKSNCLGCEDRHEGCHAECEKYKAWKEEHEEQKIFQDRETQTRTDYHALLAEKAMRREKWQKKRGKSKG